MTASTSLLSLLIVGAGPFGLSMAAFAKHFGLDHVVTGRSLEFWRSNMPKGMLLRSGVDWHLDPFDRDTIVAYLSQRGLTTEEVQPLTLDLYLQYTEWFREQQKIEPTGSMVSHLDVADDGKLFAELSDGTTLRADNVLLATGFRHFAHTPPELASLFPTDSASHTCECTDLAAFAGKRCLIVGGRQSAFEWAALLRDNEASAVYVCYRHDTPMFVASDWSWVNATLARIAEEPTWYRSLPAHERKELDHRFWHEGRAKLEPWLRARIEQPNVHLLPGTNVTSSRQNPDGELEVSIDSGRTIVVDHVIFATGYKVDMSRLPYLSDRILGKMKTADGFPVLDADMQTSVPGLYVTSLPAARDFGLFFGFTSAVRASATIVGNALRRKG